MGSIEFVLSIVKDRGMIHQATLFDLARTEFPGSIAYEAMIRLLEEGKFLKVGSYLVFLEDIHGEKYLRVKEPRHQMPTDEDLTPVEKFVADEVYSFGYRRDYELYQEAALTYSMKEIDQAIKKLGLVEVEYPTPFMPVPYKTCKMYFPKGTKVNFNN